MPSKNKKTSHEDPIISLSGGEMEERIRNFDWAQTPIGPIVDWPQSLKTAVRILLNSRYPMFVWWGPKLINIYNDAYMSVLGRRHPQALGQPAPQIWADVWPVVGPQSEIVLNQAQATWNESILLMMERYGYAEETYFTFSYSPAPDDTGRVGGVFCVCTEDTQRVIGQRQLALLRDLATKTTSTLTWQEACQHSADALASNPYDLPFAMIYITSPDGASLSLVSASGIDKGQAATPNVVQLNESAVWPFAEVLGKHNVVVVEDLQTKLGIDLPTGAWPEPPHQAALVPIGATGQTGRGGVLIVGLNPFRFFDDDYCNFLMLVAGQISASIASTQAYEEEKKRAEALAELDRTKTAFFSNVSHEFRTPLTLMLGPVEQMLENSSFDLPPTTRDQLQIVHRNSLRLLKLVNTILDFSRIEAERLQASFEPVNLAEYTADLASVFRAAMEHAGLKLIVNCSPLPQPVYVDRDMWEKIVLNLLSNAFKFTLAGEIEVRLEALEEQAQLIVRDTGVGIPIEDISRVFERFHRVKDSRGRTHEGTGIGLALVQELVKLHGGTIHAESTLGEGSQFVVTLPIGYSHLNPQHIITTPDPAPTKTRTEAFLQETLRWLPDIKASDQANWEQQNDGLAYTLRSGSADENHEPRPRIIWADDNTDMREYVSRLLDERFAVEAVIDGQAALEAAQANPPDLILSDIMMPRLDGYGLLRAIRADAQLKNVPIILLSARAGEESRIEGVEAGANDYLVKPFSARELLACVESQVKMARLRREANEALHKSEKQYRGLSTRLSVLLEATSRLIETLETQELFSSLLDLSHKIVNADAFSIWRVDDQSNWSIVASNGLSDEFIHESVLQTESTGRITVPLVLQPDDLAERSTSLLRHRKERYEREGIRSMLIMPLSIHGKISGTLVFYCRSPYFFTEAEIEAAKALTNIAAAAITTAELYETQSDLRQTAEETAVREAFLAQAGAILSESLDYEKTLTNVARVAVPQFADWCAVDLLNSEGVLGRLAVAHMDPQKVALAQELYDKYPPDPDAPGGVINVLRTGEPELVREVPEEAIVKAARDDHHLELIRELELKSYICVPLQAGSNIYGTISFVSSGSHHLFEDQDLRTAEEIARRAAQAIENASLYHNLSEGEKRLRLALGAARAGVWELEVAQGSMSWSQEFMSLYGYDADTPRTYAQWLSSIHSSDRSQVEEDFGQRLNSDETNFQQEFRITQPQAGLRWMLNVGQIERDEDGRIRRCIGINMDITERKQAEMALRESQERFRLMADAAPVLIWISDTDKLRTWFNEKWLAFVGRAMAEELGHGWTENVHPDDYARCLDTYTTAFDAHHSFLMEYRLRGHDGEYRWILDQGIPLYDAKDDFRGYIGSCVDIHDRKLAEEVLLANATRNAFRAELADALRLFSEPTALQAESARLLGEYLDTARAFYAEVEPDGNYAVIHRDYYNNMPSAAGRYRLEDFGVTVAEALRAGQTLVVNDVAHDSTLTEAQRAAFAAISVQAHATVCLVRDGRLIALCSALDSVPRTWTADEVALLEEVGDRTWAAVERANAEAALRQLNETLEERIEERTRQVRELISRLTIAEQEERRRISQILHDDLQQLLSAIKMKLSMIHQDLGTVENDELREALDEGTSWLDQAVKTTRQLTVDLSPPVLQNDGLTQAIGWLQTHMKDLHGLEVTVEAEQDWVIPDENLRVLIFQIVRELLFNVKKHADVDGAKVLLKEEEGHLVIHVIDQGKGFDVKKVEEREHQGTGFGIFSVQRRIQPLGGRLEIQSKIGEGTHLKLHTPVQTQWL